MKERIKDPAFETLLDYLYQIRGFDFTGYKRSSLMRRIERRLQMVQVTDCAAYQDYLEVHPEEFTLLFDTILINVTAFFRDPLTWEFLRQEIIPQMLERKVGGGHLRVWSAGCASGQEAYTLAIVLAEAMGPDAFRDRVKIYATDADEEALAQARQAAYTEKDLEDVPEPLRDRYFETVAGRRAFRADLRRSVIFGRHDLVQDAPISRLDLLVCRNTLMYMNAETQARILERFHFALNDGGVLVLGRAEMLLSHAPLFTPVNLRARVFSKVRRATARDRFLVPEPAARDGGEDHSAGADRFHDTLFETAPQAQAVVNATGILVQANARLRSLFGLAATDLGRPLQDLEFSYRPVELRSLIDQVTAERRPTTVSGVERSGPDGEVQYLDVEVAPMVEDGGRLVAVCVTFADMTGSHRMQEDLRRSTEELETAYEELQSSNEELETTNEELQSSNEELETMNEELQSSNEELQTVNDELRQRTDDFNQLTVSLQAVLAALPAGLAVLDTDAHVLIWNARAEDMWGLRSDEVRGRSLFSLDIGLPLAQLQEPLRACLAGEGPMGPLLLQAINRRGRTITCEVRCVRLETPGSRAVRLAVIMEDIAGRVPGAGA